MPLLKFNPTDTESAWAVWHITESENELAYASFESCPDELVSPTKRLEFLAVRALLRETCQQLKIDYQGVLKDSFGKPHLKENPHQISLTHSFPYVAIQIHAYQPVGIDLEQPKEKLTRVAGRVLSAAEQEHAGNHIPTLCVYWCAKEALYKIHGMRGLAFQSHLLIDPFQLASQGTLHGQILANPVIQASLHYLVEPDYVLVTTEKIQRL
jgi:4'-phosphopantetheinyl transferase